MPRLGLDDIAAARKTGGWEAFKRLADAIPQLVWGTSADGADVLFYNRGLSDYAGDILDRALESRLSLVHPEDLPLALASRRAAVTSSETIEADLRLRRRDGAYRWHRVTATPMLDADGAIIARIAVATDIDTIYRVERERQEGLDALRGFFDNSSIYMSLLELHEDRLVVVDCNEKTAAFFGRPVAEVVGRDAIELGLPAEPARRWLERAQACQRERRPMVRELVLPGSDPERWLLATVAPLAANAGHPPRCAYTAIDITSQKRTEDSLRVSEETAVGQLAELQAIYDSAPVGLCVHDRSMRYVRINERLAQINGRPVADHIGQKPRDVLIDLGPRIEERLERVIRTGEPVVDLDVIGETPAQPGVVRYWRVNYLPLKNAAGRVVGVNSMVTDITDIRRAEQERELLLGRIEADRTRLSAILDQLPVGVVLSEAPEGDISLSNRRARRLLGLDAITCDSWRNYGEFGGIHPDGTPLMAEEYPSARVLQTGKPVQQELLYRRPDGALVDLEVSSGPVCDGSGAVTMVVGVLEDVSERKRSQDMQNLLLAELNHRVKNMLATVQSLAQQSRRSADDLDGYYDVFIDRLIALSRAHDLLTRESWSGAGLGELARQTLAPYTAGDSTRIAIDGLRVRLNPTTAVSMNMALHELATNSAKYGALSVAGGQVRLDWRLTCEGLLRISWREGGGPPVAPPRRRGFGTRLLERGLSRELGGEVNLSFRPEGVSCTIILPLSHKVTIQ